MDFVTASTGLISPYWMGLPIRYIQFARRNSFFLRFSIKKASNLIIRHFYVTVKRLH